MVLLSPEKAGIAGSFAHHERDTGSAGVQIALLSHQIQSLTTHLKTHPKDFSSRRGLLVMVGQRRRLLKHLRMHDESAYQKIVRDLGLRHIS